MSHLLLVEDDQALASMYQYKLELVGYKVSCAYDGLSGLEKAKSTLPALILLDLKMPIMGGDEMLEKLRATEWGAQIRVIVLTNISRAEIPSKLRYLNVDRYIIKAHSTPAQMAEIVSEVLSYNAETK